ncbi:MULTISPECIES: LrgB family protein [Brevibacillus]|uniref:CidB/LrgB family autolysis modulator n=1 Tax=Brevibacillus parabrevis TaxID=54914 RepID=A0A4Y3PUF0_BREPA|nr:MULTISPECIES: LrgB family protein [Brevibacillus]MBU8712556.1 LrgB family protein [Brevibacillus parabrevis]MDH6353501.1 putative murein hydrolase (TIGR00659 family) [Brevibacillus sp. 1238]MDR5000176.1 LrgB family protein [Brevibacillus parabrevis]MED2256834.1 LrgB family protein [Brevibacillus parabrevis]NRQ56902.1 LrgB family protein [Brevibacillus sp. HD1.4A]
MMTGLIGFLLTIVIYLTAKRLYRYRPIMLFSPILFTPLLLVVLLLCAQIPYADYNEGGKWLAYMLQPATIAFAVPLYKHYPLLKKHAAQIMISVVSGSAVAVISSAVLALLLHTDQQVLYSLLPRSITTPIAMNVSQMIGGVPSITAVLVLMTGVLGSIIGPYIIAYLRISDDIARGVLLGTSAHGAGTSKAFEISPISGTVSSISMIVAALVTQLVATIVMSS